MILRKNIKLINYIYIYIYMSDSNESVEERNKCFKG